MTIVTDTPDQMYQQLLNTSRPTMKSAGDKALPVAIYGGVNNKISGAVT